MGGDDAAGNRKGLNMTITNNTLLTITETKRGHAAGTSYQMTAGEFISLVKNKDCDGDLDVGVEPILDEEGDVIDTTEDKFWTLPVAEQLDMCCRREGDRYAAHVCYEVAA